VGPTTANPGLLLQSSPSLVSNSDGRSRRTFCAHLVVFVICILLGTVFTLPGSLSPGSVLLGYAGDNFQHAWFLWHFSRAIAHANNPFYTRLILYPNRVNLAWSTTDPLAGTLALPLSLIGGPVLAYNLSVILQLALSAFFARLLCLEITRDETAALFGGAIFGFSPFFLAHALGHLSLITAFPIPLFVLILDRIFTDEHASWRLGVMLGLAMLLAALAHYDFAVLCLVVAIFWLAIELFTHVRHEPLQILRRVWQPLAAAAATFLVGFFPLLRMLVGGRSEVPVARGLHHIEQYSADAVGFLVPSWNHVILGRFVRHLDLRFFVAGFEGTVYVGPVALGLALIGFWKGRPANERWAKRAVLLCIIFYVLSLGPAIRFFGHPSNFPGPAAAFYHLPFAQFFSAPARFQAVVALCIAILCSLGIKFLRTRCRKRAQAHFVVALFAVLLLCDFLTIPFPRSSLADVGTLVSSEDRSPASAATCSMPADIRSGTVLTFPLLRAPYCMKAMWMQVSDGGRYALVDGYLSYTPQSTWTTFWNVPILRSLLSLQGILHTPVNPAADRDSARAAIRDLHLTAVVLFDSPEYDPGAAYIVNAFGVSPQRTGSCTIFRLQPSSADPAPADADTH
jgi:hypothetical protein